MCKSKAQGGQRCFPHAREKLDRATQKVNQAYADCRAIVQESGALNEHHVPDSFQDQYREALGRRVEAKAQVKTAQVEYGSTKKGHADLLNQAAEHRAKGLTFTANELERNAEAGRMLRDTNYLVSRGHDRSSFEGAGSRTNRTIVTQQVKLQRQFDTQTRQVNARARRAGHDPDYPDWSGITPTHTYGPYSQDSKENYRGMGVVSEHTVAGVLHNDDGPARVFSNGIKQHYRAGKQHNDHGPAVTYPDGVQHWFIHGTQVTQETHASWVEAGRPNEAPPAVHPRARAS